MEEIRPGDMLWVELKGADQNYGYGEVIKVWEDEKTNDKYFDFYCLVNGGFRIGNIKNIIEKPNLRMENKLLQSRRDYREVMKEKH